VGIGYKPTEQKLDDWFAIALGLWQRLGGLAKNYCIGIDYFSLIE
jgi:hypothetical protein